MVALKFTLPQKAASDDARGPYFQAKYAHYESLLNKGTPGAAWFRHQTRTARAALGQNAVEAMRNRPEPGSPFASADDTYNLFTGGRALSENLQLDRVIPPGRRLEEPTVDVDSIPAVTVKEMDWAPLVKDKHPATDPLARYVPIDQHAIFFPTFNAMLALTDEADTQGVPILQALEPRAEDAMTRERYQKQLCLSLTGLGRLLGPKLIDGVAVTGSDPYLRTGTDVAVLFEAKDPAVLKSMLAAQVALRRQMTPEAEAVQGKVAGIEYFGARSPDRSVCAYVGQLGGTNVIVVTNSLKQLERLAATNRGTIKPITAAPEYTFFRDRYARGEGNETAFIVLTDATIRRWCGPKWRIADSRRTQAAAVMADLQANYATELATGKAQPTALQTEHQVIDMGELRLTSAGVASSGYGSLEYLTPIIELPMDKVTREEAQLYGRWRDGYQQDWSNYFDPIAARLAVHDGKIEADVTVMPLIINTRYRELVELTQGVKLAPDAGDPHDALVHFAMALNRDSAPVKMIEGFAKQAAPHLRIEPFAWLGKSVSVYVDDDPLWKEAAAAEDPEKFMNDNWHRLPVAARVASDSPFKLAAFMTAVHAFVDQSAPNVTGWETVDHHGRSYVRISSRGSGIGEVDKAKLYYATLPDALVLTLNEDVIKRALDRESAREDGRAGPATRPAAPAAGDPAGPVTRPATRPVEFQPWLGESVAIQVDTRAVQALREVIGQQYRSQMQQMAWANVPVLNEWKRLYPDQDPVKVHERLWQTRLVDPAGGSYVWNEQYQTMESTTYGHPGAPKEGPGLPPQLNHVTRAAAGITFENQGLRAKVVLEHNVVPK